MALPRALTQADIALVTMLASGLSNKEIGSRLKIVESTTKNRLTGIYHKLNANDRVQAILTAHALRLIDLSELADEFYRQQASRHLNGH